MLIRLLYTYMQELEDAKTSVYFYEKCIEIARVTGKEELLLFDCSLLQFLRRCCVSDIYWCPSVANAHGYTGNKSQEMLCNSYLGTVYGMAKDLVSSIDYNERPRELAMQQDNLKEIHKANAALVKVYLRYASEREYVGAYDDSIHYFEKCLDVSMSTYTCRHK